jgi:hypothetical protein
MPSLSESSLAIRSSPQVEFSLVIFRINRRMFFGSGGRPGLRDFRRQNSLNAVRCHLMKSLRLNHDSGFAPVEEARKDDHREPGRPGDLWWFRFALVKQCQLPAQEEILGDKGIRAPEDAGKIPGGREDSPPHKYLN